MCFTWVGSGPTRKVLGWKGLPCTNTLAYYENPKITAVKSFIKFAQGLLSPSLRFKTSFATNDVSLLESVKVRRLLVENHLADGHFG